ncbi:MAG: iron-sulfur cluster assembly accessory protein [Fimbriimonadaceae bacterium]|nr:iron-sulfur cluster assembly accessory protein [Fimbriimonadaceae bacterium]
MSETSLTEATVEFPVTLTPSAIVRLKQILEKDGRSEAFLRVGVKGGGCSGFEYLTKIDTALTERDMSLEVDGVTVVCDRKSARFLAGSTLDYTGNLIGGGFQFENPNAARSCGCGTSFTPKGI